MPALTPSNTCCPARWDHDGVRDGLREFVTERLGTENSVLVIDETGDVKKGTSTVGTQRQYTGTAGRIENAQVAVYAVWATRRGAAFVDRELYVPASWTNDPARCQAAGLPAELEFATKPALALGVVERALAAGARPDWVADLQQQLLQLGVPFSYLRHITGPVLHDCELPDEPDQRTTTEGLPTLRKVHGGTAPGDGNG